MEGIEVVQDDNASQVVKNSSGKAAKIQEEFDSLADIFIDSNDEFEDVEDENFRIGKYQVCNYVSPKESIAANLEVPKDILTDKFKPKVVSFNNQVVFVATGSGVTSHKGGKKGCPLGPCRIFWHKGDEIAKVRILIGLPAQIDTELWVCRHHHKASLDGFTLQCQFPVKKKTREISKRWQK